MPKNTISPKIRKATFKTAKPPSSKSPPPISRQKSPQSLATNLQLISELKSLSKDAKALSKEVQNLKNLEFVQILKHPSKFLVLSLLKGMMVGLGSVIGATVLVALLIFLLSKISLVPIVGDFLKEIITEISSEQTAAPKQEADLSDR